MIFYITIADNRETMDHFLAVWGYEHFKSVQVLVYESFLLNKRFPPGLYVFSDIELLSDEQRQRAVEIYNALGRDKQKYQLLNHPARSMIRFKLLRTLFEKGINRFNVYRLDEAGLVKNFPVFLRKENDHGGNKTDLLNNINALNQAIAALPDPADKKWMITEFMDIKDETGLFRKYSCFFINGDVVARHILFSRRWAQKYGDLIEDRYVEEELKFLNENPHRNQVKTIFDLARIDYGRVDYGITEGKIQVWEINTNPNILTRKHLKIPQRLAAHKTFYKNFSAALNRLAEIRTGQPCKVSAAARLDGLLHILYEKTGAGKSMKPVYAFCRRTRNAFLKSVIWKIKPWLRKI